jgi:hypothetical protein
MEHVVERAALASNIPILFKTNYADWAAVIRFMVQARGLWDAVNIDTMDFTEDHMALEALDQGCSTRAERHNRRQGNSPHHLGRDQDIVGWG